MPHLSLLDSKDTESGYGTDSKCCGNLLLMRLESREGNSGMNMDSIFRIFKGNCTFFALHFSYSSRIRKHQKQLYIIAAIHTSC